MLSVILIPLVLIGFYTLSESAPLSFLERNSFSSYSIFLADVPVGVAIADSLEERTQGLSGRESIPENAGLLFIFDRVGAHGIWMKEMLFPIDIIWIGENLQVVDIKKSIAPDSYPQVFYPRSNARYVLEVNALFTEIWGIKVGDRVTLPSALERNVPK